MRDTNRYKTILYLACFLFAISWYLPSPLIEGQDTSFVTHLIGGGMFSGLLGIYIIKANNIRLGLFAQFAVLFGLVSSLGVVNELFEFMMVKLHIASILITDTSWDLVANTLGMLIVFVAYSLSETRHDRRN